MNRFEKARRAAGLTQTELAKLLGITSVSVHAWEYDVSRPKKERLQEVADVLHTTVDYLLGKSEGKGA